MSKDFYKAKKALGQNFLIDDDVIEAIAQAAVQDPADTVLEIGPGRGALTSALCERAAAVKAVETVDSCVGRVVEAIRKAGGVLCITADHGNCEQMLDKETGAPFTQHTTNPVPFILVNARHPHTLRKGKLCDIAPTLLQLAGLDVPKEMSGVSLIEK